MFLFSECLPPVVKWASKRSNSANTKKQILEKFSPDSYVVEKKKIKKITCISSVQFLSVVEIVGLPPPPHTPATASNTSSFSTAPRDRKLLQSTPTSNRQFMVNACVAWVIICYSVTAVLHSYVVVHPLSFVTHGVEIKSLQPSALSQERSDYLQYKIRQTHVLYVCNYCFLPAGGSDSAELPFGSFWLHLCTVTQLPTEAEESNIIRFTFQTCFTVKDTSRPLQQRPALSAANSQLRCSSQTVFLPPLTMQSLTPGIPIHLHQTQIIMKLSFGWNIQKVNSSN